MNEHFLIIILKKTKQSDEIIHNLQYNVLIILIMIKVKIFIVFLKVMAKKSYLIYDEEVLDDFSVSEGNVSRLFDGFGQHLPNFLSNDASVISTILWNPHSVGEIVAELVIVQLHLSHLLQLLFGVQLLIANNTNGYLNDRLL